MNKYYIGIDVGATNTRIGLVSADFKIIASQSYDSNQVAKDFNFYIKAFINDHPTYQIEAISIGFPGLVDQAKRRVVNTPNQKGFEGDYLKALEEELQIQVIIDNDVNYLLLYDAKHFNIDPNQSVLGFYLGTGFGNAIRLGSNLYQGTFGAAGEIGHIPIYDDFDPNKAKQNHLECITSGYQLINLHKTHFSQTPFDQLFKVHFDHPLIQKFLHYLAFAIATEMIILDIPTIILGGGVIMSEQFPRQFLEKIIRTHLRSEEAKNAFKVYYAQSDVKSGILGAVIYATYYLKNHT